MDRRKRNKLCIWLIFLGVINVTAYTAVYACIGGDAINGYISETGEYVLRGHFIRGTRGGEAPCSRGVWFYSYFHSLSIIPTCVAILVPLMILARPHIIATMREGSWVQGTTFISVSMTLVIALAVIVTFWFCLQFINQLWG